MINCQLYFHIHFYVNQTYKQVITVEYSLITAGPRGSDRRSQQSLIRCGDAVQSELSGSRLTTIPVTF